MSHRTLRLTQILLFVVAGGGVAAASVAPRDRSVPPLPPRSLSPTTPDSGRLGEAALEALRRDDPFRLDRRHPALRYDPDRPPPPPPPVPPPPVVRPPWRLTGILEGPDPVAVLEGLAPPDSTRLVQVGDTVDGRVIDAIVADTLRVAEQDSLWSFVVAAPWSEGGAP